MGLSIFEINTTESFSGAPLKSDPVAGKLTGEAFAKVFKGCLSECAGVVSAGGVSSGTANAPGSEGGAVQSDAASLAGIIGAALLDSAVKGAKASPEAGNIMTNAPQVEKPITQGVNVEGAALPTDASVESASEGTAVGTDTAQEVKPRVICEAAGLKSLARTTGKAKAIEPGSARVTGTVAVMPGESSGEVNTAAVDTRTGVKSVGQENTVKLDGKNEDHDDEKDIYEKEQTADVAQRYCCGATAGLSPEEAKPATADLSRKNAFNAFAAKPDATGCAAARVPESCPESRPVIAVDKPEVGKEMTGKARAAMVISALDTPASVRSAVIQTVKTATEEVNAAPSEGRPGASNDIVSPSNGPTEKEGIKTAAADRNVSVKGPVPVKTDTLNNNPLTDIATKTPLPAPSPQSLQENGGVKVRIEHPSVDRATDTRTEVHAGDGTSVGSGEQNRTAPVASSVNAFSQDLSSDNGEKSGDNETGRKSGTGIELSHGVQHQVNDKQRFDVQTAKPVEPARPEAVFEKLSTGVRMSLAGSAKTVSISLSPEHLGSMHIKMSVDDSSVKARIIVESEAAKAVLDSDSGKLREVFASHGLTLDRYSVELSTNAFSGGPSHFNGAPSGESHYGGRAYHGAGSKGPDTPADHTTYRQAENSRRTSGGVDIFV